LAIPQDVARSSPWLDQAFQELLKDVWSGNLGFTGNRSIPLSEVMRAVNHAQHEHLEALPPAVKSTVSTGLHNMTELHLAAWAGNLPAVRHFLAHDAPVCQQDAMGQTPAHLAAKMGWENVYGALVEVDSCAGATDAAGLTAADLLPPDPSHPSVQRQWRGLDSPPATSGASRKAEPGADAGGWPLSNDWDWLLEDGRCDIPEVDGALTPQEFMKYVIAQRPVIMRGAARDWAFRREWTKAGVVRESGELEASVGGVPFPEAFGLEHNRMSVAEYVNLLENEAERAQGKTQLTGRSRLLRRWVAQQGRPPPYIFGSLALHGGPTPDEFTFLHGLEGLIRSHDEDLLVYIGPPGSGAPSHIHADAVNAAAFGRKHWFFYPPSRSYFSTQPMQEWLAQRLLHVEESRPYRCTQEAGDVVFVPFDWGHSVVNLDASIGVAMELLVWREHMFPCDDCEEG